MAPTIDAPLRILLISIDSAEPPRVFPDGIETHEIRTPYYNASIPIWRDNISSDKAAIDSWKAEWTDSGNTDAAATGPGEDDQAAGVAEVVGALGAWIVCFRKPVIAVGEKRDKSEGEQSQLESIKHLLKTIHEVFNHHRSISPTLAYSTLEPLFLAVGIHDTNIQSATAPDPTPSASGIISTTPNVLTDEYWEDLCQACGGWEWIDCSNDDDSGKGRRNEFGEKVGVERLIEVLQSNEWELDGAAGGEDEDGEGGEDGDEDSEALGLREGLLQAGEGDDATRDTEASFVRRRGQTRREGDEQKLEEEDVAALESAMLKMQAVRDLGADLPEPERRRLAAKAVRDVMKTF